MQAYPLLRPSCHLQVRVSSHSPADGDGGQGGQRTNCELDLGRAGDGGREGAGGIERGQPLRAHAAHNLLAHHCGREAGWGYVVE